MPIYYTHVDVFSENIVFCIADNKKDAKLKMRITLTKFLHDIDPGSECTIDEEREKEIAEIIDGMEKIDATSFSVNADGMEVEKIL